MQPVPPLAVALAISLLVSCGCSAVDVSPLSSVIGLLKDLSAKVTKESETAENTYLEYSKWCHDTKTQTGFEIKSATSDKGKLEAKINEMASIEEVTSSKISELAADIASCTAELQNATSLREKEAADFVASEKELVEVIDTLDRASSILQREMKQKPSAFTQFQTSGAVNVLRSLGVIADAAALTGAQKQQLYALAQSSQSQVSDDDDVGAPEAAVYKTHSGSIFDLLEDLREKAEGQLSDVRKAETTSRHNYEMLKQSLEDQMDADESSLAKAKAGKASASEEKAVASGDLEQTVNDLTSAEEMLATTTSSCEETSKNHEASMKAREEELKIIAEAIKVLGETTSGAGEKTYSFVQTRAVSRLHTRADLVKLEVVAMVQRLAQTQHSAMLSQLASRIRAVVRMGAHAGEDPFQKVKGLIQELIEKLEAEASAEATEKAFCDKELAKTASKKEELSADIAKLTTKLDQAAARAASLKAAVKELQGELATLAETQAKMDKIRNDAHTAYLQAKQDLETGLGGVRKAISVLREYFANKEDTPEGAFLQSTAGQPAAPTMFAKEGGAASSIIGILEQVESDFAENLAKEETEESSAAEDYTKLTQENKLAVATKEQDVKYNTKEAAALDKDISELSSDREGLDAELAAVLEYDDKMKERCIAKPETYEGRKARREAEIAGLKEALSVLESEAALLQRGQRGAHRLRGLLVPSA